MNKFFTLFFISLAVYSCKKEEPREPVPIQLTSFPMATGNVWMYHTMQTVAIGDELTFESYNTSMETLKDTLIEWIYSIKMLHKRLNYYTGSEFYRAYFYYANHDSGFSKTAYVASGGELLHFKDELSQQGGVGFFDTPLSGTAGFIQFLDPPQLLLKFPVVMNDVWNSHATISSGIKRKWLGYETITTKAGTFNCIKMQLIYDFNDDWMQDEGSEIVHQYFSDKGLIRESFGFEGGDPNTPTVIIKNTDLVQINF